MIVAGPQFGSRPTGEAANALTIEKAISFCVETLVNWIGTFDPLTYGHLDIIERAARLYARLIVAVGQNPLKTEVFTADERRDMLVEHTSAWHNVDVQTYSGLTVEFARTTGARTRSTQASHESSAVCDASGMFTA